MTRTQTTALSLAIALAGIAAVNPAQAASRFVDISPERMANNCQRTGGTFYSPAAGIAVCDLPSVAITCALVSTFQADCRWPGIELQVAVTRVIGMSDAIHVGSSSSGGEAFSGGGGGFQGPGDLKAGPGNDPKPGFDGPDDFQMAP